MITLPLCAVCGKPVHPRHAGSLLPGVTVHGACTTHSEEAAAFCAEAAWARAERPCPQCGAKFVAAGNRGACPQCRLVFFASHPAVRGQRPEFPYLKAEAPAPPPPVLGAGAPLPFRRWPKDKQPRWLAAANTFGRHLLAGAYAGALAQVGPAASPAARQAAAQAALQALHGVLALLDGVADTRIDPEHSVEYALLARIRRDGEARVLEQIELAPSGDGLGLGLAGWEKGDFGQA